MDYMTTDQIRDWASDQPDDALYCIHCLTRLVPTDEGLWYCPNEMCANDEQGEINLDDED